MSMRIPRRSVSPFGVITVEINPFEEFDKALEPLLAGTALSIKAISDAPSNDDHGLGDLCRLFLNKKIEIEGKGLITTVDQAMKLLFERKTELFLLSPDGTLFAKERDLMVGGYFAPLAEHAPGQLSEFVEAWLETTNLDRLLHFFDFCLGSKKPTFEHYLLFAHPAFARVLRDKAKLRALLQKTDPLIKKLTFPAWEKAVHQTFEI